MVRNVATFFLIISLIISCTSAEIVRITPGSGSVSSTQIHDATMGANNSVIFATDNGLSIYFCDSGSWRIMHPDYSNREAGIHDNFILAVEPDRYGNGWFGYPDALQVYDGNTFTTVKEPYILYKNSINDLQLRKDEIWAAVGKSGLIRFGNSSYEWFQPFRESGLNAHRIISLAVDPEDDRLIAVSYSGGAWALEENEGTYSFKQIPVPSGEKILKGVRSDPYGGVFIFSDKNIYRYRGGSVSHFISVDAIDRLNVSHINDVTVSREGVVIVATDDGIAGYFNSEMVLRLKNRDGLGGYSVRFLYTDADGRIWYSVRDNAGYIYPLSDHLRTEIPVPSAGTVQPETTETAIVSAYADIDAAGETGETTTEDTEGGDMLAEITGFFSSLWDTLMKPPQEII